MTKVKILVDARVLEGEGQGSATYIKGIYNTLAEQYPSQYDIYLAGINFSNLKKHFPFLDEAHFIPIKSSSTFKRLFFDFPQLLKKHAFDYAHFQYVVPLRAKANCKFIVTIHDILFNDFPEEFSTFYRLSRNVLFRYAAWKSDLLLTVSNYSKERLVAHYGIESDRIHITPNAIDERYRLAFDKQASTQFVRAAFEVDNYILYVSRIEPRKNHLLLLRAFRELKLWQHNIQLVFVGNQTLDTPELQAEMEKMTPKEKRYFKWISQVDDYELLELYRAARLFVYPSKAEGFGIPPIEAAALGTPTICANATAMKDFDFLGVHQFDPGHYGAFCQLLESTLFRPFPEGYWNKIAKEVAERYSWTVAAQCIHEQVQELAKKDAITQKAM
ncbi:MAG: glycosyltransferase family 1 protein [Bacteroidota bacterium]